MERSALLLSFLICTFAIGSWIDLNGVWVELPLLTNRLPERWDLPSYIVIIVQIANVAPIIYMIMSCMSKQSNIKSKIERISIYLILILGMICCCLLAKFWCKTVIIDESKQIHRSIPFLTLICLLSIVDTTSSVTFLPYLVQYHHRFVTALYVGEGLSGLLPGIVGLIQGVGDEPKCSNHTYNGTNDQNSSNIIPQLKPRFSISIFFIILAVIMLICLICFSLVDNLKIFKQYRVKPMKYNTNTDEDNDGGISNNNTNNNEFSIGPSSSSESGNSDIVHPYHLTSSINRLIRPNRIYDESVSFYLALLYVAMIGYINLLTNGLLPSIQNFSLQPYSNKLYHIVITISQIINPIACLLTLKRWKITPLLYLIMLVAASLCASYIIVLAAWSPNPPAINGAGPYIAAASWFFMGAVFSFMKTMLAIELQTKGRGWLQTCGAFTQLGSAFGAIIGFILVVVKKVFVQKNPC